MLGLDWSELAVIAVVALVFIGPKDLPGAVRGLAQGIQKLRRMAGEFQGHVDEMVREAKLDEVRNQINEIRNFDLKGEVERAVDKDGSIRKTFEEDPLRTDYTATPPSPVTPAAAPETAPAAETAGGPAGSEEAQSAAVPAPPPESGPPEPPAFIPPDAVRAAEAGSKPHSTTT
jgi:sec-independent protein translocase protein TatB